MNLRYFEIARFYVLMGIDLTCPKFKDIVYQITEASRHVAYDPPSKLLELVLEFGADVDWIDMKTCGTALTVACKSQNLAFVKLLVKYGAEIGVVDKQLKMPINYVMKQKTMAQKKIYRFLNRAGAKTSWKYDKQ